ncbi:MAG: hypothetical protein JWM53_4495 [bacterium]|nr:hypothetical protein [bacterium]
MCRNLTVALLVISGALGCSKNDTGGPASPDLATSSSAPTSDMAMSPTVANDLAQPAGTVADLAGATWTLEDAHGLAVTGIFAAGVTEVWAIGMASGGTTGGILHSTGNGQWAQLQSTNSAPRAIWGPSAHDIWVAGAAGLLLHTVDGITWTASNYWSSHATREIDVIWGSGANDLYVSTMVSADGTTGLYHSTGGDTWTAVALPAMTTGPLAIWGSGSTDLYGVDNTILHSVDGGAWMAQATAVGANAVWGSGAQDIYIVGSGGSNAGSAILHSTGDGHWTQQFALTKYNVLNRIWGASATDLWGVGGGEFGTSWVPVVVHSSGDGKWTSVTVPEEAGYLRAIDGASGQVFIGSDGGILHLH